MNRLLTLPLLALALYWGMAYLTQRATLFPAPRDVPRHADGPPFGAESLWLGPAGNVEAWYFPPPPGQRPAPAMVFAHGNGELIDYWADTFQVPRAWGAGIVLVEYPGYGRSGGKPSQKAIEAVMADAYDALVARKEIDPQRIIAYGRSLGGGAASALAAQRPVAAIVLESSFASVTRIARGYGVPPFLVRDPFDSVAVLQAYEGPVLVLHGEHDRIVPVSHAHELDAAAQRAELQLLPCGHNDCPRPWEAIQTFLDRHKLLRPPGQPLPSGDAMILRHPNTP